MFSTLNLIKLHSIKVSDFIVCIKVKKKKALVVLLYLGFFCLFFKCEKSPSAHRDCGAAQEGGVGGGGWLGN